MPDPNSIDRRGWWADSTSEADNDQIGSRLWLLERAKNITETLRKAEEYAIEALQWMITEGIASKIEATATSDGTVTDALRLDLQVRIFKDSGEVTAVNFLNAWEEQLNAI